MFQELVLIPSSRYWFLLYTRLFLCFDIGGQDCVCMLARYPNIQNILGLVLTVAMIQSINRN
jgi:hypothetical protein